LSELRQQIVFNGQSGEAERERERERESESERETLTNGGY